MGPPQSAALAKEPGTARQCGGWAAPCRREGRGWQPHAGRHQGRMTSSFDIPDGCWKSAGSHPAAPFAGRQRQRRPRQPRESMLADLGAEALGGGDCAAGCGVPGMTRLDHGHSPRAGTPRRDLDRRRGRRTSRPTAKCGPWALQPQRRKGASRAAPADHRAGTTRRPTFCPMTIVC
jgi:hypothetical protein